MNSKFMKAFVVVVLALMVVPAAFAQTATTGRIDGTVSDDQGASLPGVTVTLNSASLQGERIQVTGADGKFRFLNLPPGSYDLRANLEGFAILEQSNIAVGLNRTVTLQLTMSTAFGEEVTVSGAAPIIDTTTTTSGANFSEALFQELPVGRTFTGIAFAAPGVVSGGLGNNPSIGGASAAENRYVVDGLDTTDPAFGTFGTQVPFEFVKEVEIKTGGYEAEYGGALGGVVNVVTKSGGNDLEGDIFGYYSDDAWQSDVPPTASFGQDLGFTEYDFGAAIGGKFIQDKLWYFVAVNPSTEDEEYTTRQNLITETETTDRLYYAGKLTWQVNPSHQLVFSTFGDPTEVDNNTVRNSYGHLATDDEFGAANYGITYNGTLTSSLFLELSAGRYDEDVTSLPLRDVPFYQQRGHDPAANPGKAYTNTNPCGDSSSGFETTYSYTVDPSCEGATFVQENNDRSRDEYRGALTWFGATGSIDHEVKLGTTYRDVEYADDARYPGPAPGPFFDSNGGSDPGATGVTNVGVPVDPTGLRGQRWLMFNGFSLLLEYQQDSQGETEEQAIYLQDRVRLSDYFSLNLGVRADSFESRGGGADPITGEFVDVSAQFPDRKLDFSFSDMVAPRIGFTWDVAKNGRSKLYGHFGQFFESVPLDINARAFGTEIFNFFYFYYPEDGSIPTGSNPGTHFYSYPLGVGVGVSSDIEPMYTEEALVGFEYEVAPNLAVGVKYTTRSIENVIEDISVDGGTTYFITNPGGTTTVNPVTGEPLAEPAIFPEPVRDYEAVELTLNKRFTNNWQLYGSAVWSENKGNYGGLFRQDNGQLDPNITSLYDLPSLLVGANGLLPNDREYQFKLYGSYLWDFKLITGFYFQWLDGTPISQLGAHPSYGRQERFVTPRGSFGRTPDTYNLDVHLEYPFSFGNGMELKLIGDIFNISDEQEPTTVDQEWTSVPLPETPDPPDAQNNPNFNTPTNYQSPRTFRLGVKLSW